MKPDPQQQPGKQQGVALITALLIVALATIVSVKISTHLQLDIRRTGNIIANEQAIQYNMEAEAWARRILKTDREDSTIDHLEEDWALEIPPLPVEGGTISGKLSDLQACINLNTLAAGDDTGILAQERFNQLAQSLGYTGNLSQSIADWIDGDLETRSPDGAEDIYYLNLDKPYRTANTKLHSVSELRLIKGFEDHEKYEILAPNLCALEENTSINVNTAPVEVLKSLSNEMTIKDAEAIIAQRQEDPFDNIDEFLNINNLKEIIKPEKQKNLSVNTSYFLLLTESHIGQARTLMYSIIKRNDEGKTEVVARTQGAF